MKNKLTNELLVKEIYKKYQDKYNIQLPEIQNIIFSYNTDSWANFFQQDLYNKKYILHVDDKLFSEDIRFVKQTLFHEFTHIADSLSFNNKSFEEFKKIMISYSEFHASQREMLERINQSHSEIVDLQTIVYYSSEESLDLLMKHSFEVMKVSLNKMECNKGKNKFFYDPKLVYYYYGYISALQSYGINYIVPIQKIPNYIVTQLIKIQVTLLDENINIENVLQTYSEFERAIIIKSIQNEKKEISKR